MQGRKDTSIEFRISQEEKEKIKEYCEKRGIKTSEFIRALIQKEMNQKEDK